jgi:hypothetical protein
MESRFNFGCKFGCENYLNLIKDELFLKFRISNHRLQIETGRYIKPKIVPENRICEKCFSSEVEDEQHCFFLLNCGFYRNHRNKLFEVIKSRICILEILCKSLIILTCKFENFKLLSSRIYIVDILAIIFE